METSEAVRFHLNRPRQGGKGQLALCPVMHSFRRKLRSKSQTIASTRPALRPWFARKATSCEGLRVPESFCATAVFCSLPLRY